MLHYMTALRFAKPSNNSDYSPVGSSEQDSSEHHLLEKDEQDLPKRGSIWNRYKKFILVQILLLILYTTIWFLTVRKIHLECLHGPNLIQSPANEAVLWEEHKFVLGDRIQEKGRYSGKPSRALDQAWHDLLNDENIRIEPAVMKRLGREEIGVQIPDSDGFIGTLNVYHEIHCLKRLHQYMYQDHYWPNLSEAEREMNRLHNEHCIDFLRQSAMCHGDVGLITFEWAPTDRIPVANATTHQCVNWKKLNGWMKERSVDMLKPNWLVHPLLGPSFPDGEGDNIGAAKGNDNDH